MILSLSEGKVKVGCWLFGGSVVKSQLHPKVPKLFSPHTIWTGVVHTKFQLIWTRNEEVQKYPRRWLYHYLRKNVKVGCWLVGCSVVKSQLLPSVPKLKPRDIIWTGVVE